MCLEEIIQRWRLCLMVVLGKYKSKIKKNINRRGVLKYSFLHPDFRIGSYFWIVILIFRTIASKILIHKKIVLTFHSQLHLGRSQIHPRPKTLPRLLQRPHRIRNPHPKIQNSFRRTMSPPGQNRFFLDQKLDKSRW